MVKVQCIRTGTIKTMAQKFADILIVLGKVKIYEEPEEAPEYETKMMVADKPKRKRGRPKKQSYETKDMVAK